MDRLRLRGRALAVEKEGMNWRVVTDGEPIEARRLLLAIGLGEQPCWPGWARRLKSLAAAVDHIFDPAYTPGALAGASRILVIGAGVSGVQAALSLSADGRRRVTLVAGRPLAVNNLDFDPCWIGPN